MKRSKKAVIIFVVLLVVGIIGWGFCRYDLSVLVGFDDPQEMIRRFYRCGENASGISTYMRRYYIAPDVRNSFEGKKLISSSAVAIFSGGKIDADYIEEARVIEISVDEKQYDTNEKLLIKATKETASAATYIVDGSYKPSTRVRTRYGGFGKTIITTPPKHSWHNFRHRVEMVRINSRWYISSIESLE